MHDLVTDGSPAVICSHRPALPTILEALAEYGSSDHAPVLAEAAALPPAHMTVVHLTAKAVGKKRAIVSIETYAPVAPLPPKVMPAPKDAAAKEKPKPAPKTAKGNKNSK